MRFPRQTKVFRGQLDAAPFVAVFFLMVLFLLLHSSLVFPPGVEVKLPQATNLPGTDRPLLAVAVDAGGDFYFENQLVSPGALEEKLSARVANSAEPFTLLVQADRNVSYETIVHLSALAERAGVRSALLATRPVARPVPNHPSSP